MEGCRVEALRAELTEFLKKQAEFLETRSLGSATTPSGCCYGDFELSLAPNQEQLTASSYLYDSDLNAESYYALNDREDLNTLCVYGAKFSPDSQLLFQPSTIGMMCSTATWAIC